MPERAQDGDNANPAEEQEQAEDLPGEEDSDAVAPDTGGDTDEEVGETFPASDPPANY